MPRSVFNVKVHRINKCRLGPFCIHHWVYREAGESCIRFSLQKEPVDKSRAMSMTARGSNRYLLPSSSNKIDLPLEDSCAVYNLHMLHLFSTFPIWLQLCINTGLRSITIPCFTQGEKNPSQTHEFSCVNLRG